MSIESRNSIFSPTKIAHSLADTMIREKERGQKRKSVHAAKFFRLKDGGEWVENGCDKCGAGMSKRIYDFQRENRPQGTICSQCSKREDKKLLKKSYE